VYRVEICRAFQHTSKYQKERPAERDDEDQQIKGFCDQEDSVSKWTGESRECSIDKWIGGHQGLFNRQVDRWTLRAVQSTSGSVDAKEAQVTTSQGAEPKTT
jgi:hypothetical protein